MKKRINDSEIEKAKHSNKLLFLLTTLMLLVVICGFVFYFLYDKGLIKFDENVTEEKELDSGVVVSSITKTIKNDNSDVLKLLNNVSIIDNQCDGYNTKKAVDVSMMSDKCKFSLALNEYKNKITSGDGVTYVLESDVIASYEGLFGYNTYKTQNTIPYINNSVLLYNSLNKYYFLNEEKDEVGTPMTSYEKVLSIKRDGNNLYINTAVLYYDSVNKVLCRDYDCESVLDNMDSEPSYPDYYSLYTEHNYKKLYQYSYNFKMDKTGFYKYVGFKRTNK